MDDTEKHSGLMNTLKHRILRNWTARRVMYLAAGSIFIGQGIYMHEWIPALAGGYFAVMGILGFGCAATGCCSIPPPPQKK